MPPRPRRLPLLAYVVGALLCAAASVVYLQHKALLALDRQTGLILQKIAEQTAGGVAQDLRALFDGPVFDTLATVNHPVLRAADFGSVAVVFTTGLERYPHVERFFIWHERTEEVAPAEVLFFGREARGLPAPSFDARFSRDPALGRRVLDVAHRDADTQRIYAVHHVEEGEVPLDVFVRIFYTDAERTKHFAILGFVVNLAQVRTRLFPELARTRLRPRLEPPGDSPRFDLRVIDERGVQVAGPAGPPPAFSGRAPLSLLFYPAGNIEKRLAAALPDRRWALVLSPRGREAPGSFASTETQGYWLSGLSVLLMLVALAFIVQGQRQAEQLARMQGEFVANVSHQLKTPLSLLTAVTETLTLERVRSPEKFAQYLDILRTETSRLSSLVARVLEFAHVEGGTRRFELEEVDLGRLVADMVESLRPGMERSGVVLKANVPVPGPTVVADPAALEQVVLALLDNAVKYSPDRKDITVRVAASGPNTVLEVADRGCGVPAAERTRIFERFYRGGCGRGQPQGFGLGLAIVREIVGAHRGRVGVEPNPGGGSVFRVSLPTRERASAPAYGRMPWPFTARVK